MFVATGLGQTSARSHAAYHVSTGNYRPVQFATAAKAKAKSGVSIDYVYGTATLQPNQEFTGGLKCPAKFPHPISGGFDSSSGKTFMTTSRPDPPGTSAHSAHTWIIGEVNLDTQAANVLAVLVCAK